MSAAFLSSTTWSNSWGSIGSNTGSQSFEKLPDFGRKFDLITAFATAFHGGHEDSWRWGEKEWDFFLTDLKEHLKPGGRIFFDLNAAYDGEYYTPEILKVLQKHGGVIERGHVSFSRKSSLAIATPGGEASASELREPRPSAIF